MPGYDQFFKQARKASAASSPKTTVSSNERGQAATKDAPGRARTRASVSPEARMKALFERRLAEKRRARAARRTPFPKGPFAAIVIGVIVSTAGALNPEAMDWVLEHVEIGVYGSAVAAEQEKSNTSGQEGAPAKAAETQTTDAAKAAATTGATKSESVPDTRTWSKEELSFFNKLSERKKELDLREAELNRLEEELQKQKVELDEKIKQLESTRSQIAQTLKGRVENDQAKVSKLVEVYSGMKPAQAAKVIETINEDLAVQILDRMKKKSAANILNVMNADKAQRLSEMLAGYKRN